MTCYVGSHVSRNRMRSVFIARCLSGVPECRGVRASRHLSRPGACEVCHGAASYRAVPDVTRQHQHRATAWGASRGTAACLL